MISTLDELVGTCRYWRGRDGVSRLMCHLAGDTMYYTLPLLDIAGWDVIGIVKSWGATVLCSKEYYEKIGGVV